MKAAVVTSLGAPPSYADNQYEQWSSSIEL